MDAIAERRVGAGVFRPLMHIIAPDAPQIIFNGIPLWFAACGAACVPVPRTLAGRQWCQKCLALVERAAPASPRRGCDGPSLIALALPGRSVRLRRLVASRQC